MPDKQTSITAFDLKRIEHLCEGIFDAKERERLGSLEFFHDLRDKLLTGDKDSLGDALKVVNAAIKLLEG